jgi:hypothetical protein
MMNEDNEWIVINDDDTTPQKYQDNKTIDNKQCNETIESIDLKIVRNENPDIAIMKRHSKDDRQCDFETTINDLLDIWRSAFQTLKKLVTRFLNKLKKSS